MYIYIFVCAGPQTINIAIRNKQLHRYRICLHAQGSLDAGGPPFPPPLDQSSGARLQGNDHIYTYIYI